MSQVFTDYVRSLSDAGEPSDLESFRRLERALRGALRKAIKQRGLWESSPSYLGVYGWQRWQESSPGARQAGDDALGELAAECYVYIFLRRLRSLRAHLRLKPNVDGLVYRGIRHFLHETQKSHDPLGFRIFNILRSALEAQLEDGRIHVLGRGKEIGNGTVFGSAPGPVPAGGGAADLGDTVRVWNDDLLPGIVTARGSQEAEVVARLGRKIGELRDGGLEVFRFKDMIDPLKADIRARWAAMFQEAQGETGYEDAGGAREIVHLLDPDVSFEDRESFRRLVSCVSGHIERLGARAKTRRHLSTYWRFLSTFAADAGLREKGVAEIDGGARPPSQRTLSKLLGIPRDRFAELNDLLRGLLERCRERRGGGSGDELAAPLPSDPEARRAELRRRAAAVLGEVRELESEADLHDSEARPGDLLVLRETAEHGVEWLVLDARDGWAEVVPADTVPLAGSADVEVGDDRGLGPLTVRCRHATRIPASACDPELRTARLGSPLLKRARRQIERVAAGRAEVSPARSEVDLDPEYRSWDAEVAAARAALERHLHRPEPASRRPPRRPRRRRERWLALAAAVLAVLSLVLVRLWWGERQTGRRLAAEIDRWRRSSREAVVNVPLAIPREDRRRGPDDGQVVVPSGVPSFLVYIQAPEVDPDDTSYRLELLDQTGERLRVWTGVRDNDLSEITLLMPRQLLPAGEYHILLFRDGEPRALRSLRFDLVLE